MVTIRRTASVIGWVLCIALLVLVWPTRFGGWTSLTVVSGESMQPTYFTGDLVAGWKTGDYAPGDVVVYRVPRGEEGAGHQVIHRLLAVDSDGRWTVQGDNKAAPDPWHPTDEDIVGEAVFVVAGLGSMLNWLPLLLALVAGALVTAGLWPRRSADTGATDPDADSDSDDHDSDRTGRQAPKHRAPVEEAPSESDERRVPTRTLQGAGVALTIAVVAILASSAATAFDRPASAAGFGGITTESAREWVLTGQEQLGLPCVAPDECRPPVAAEPDDGSEDAPGMSAPEGDAADASVTGTPQPEEPAQQVPAQAPAAVDAPAAPEQSPPVEAPATDTAPGS